MEDTTRVRMTLAGEGPEADRWAAALRSIEAVQLRRAATGEDALLESVSGNGGDGMVFVAPVGDLAGSIKRAMLTGRSVLVAGPAALSSKQLLGLADLAVRRNRAIVLDGGILADEHLAFVRKMTAGANPLWRPRYTRVLRTGAAAESTLDTLALTEIGRVLAVAGGLPSTVSAWSPRLDDETGGGDVVLMTLVFDGGTVARLDISLVEPVLRQELVIACDARTIVLQPLDREAPLLIQAGGRHRGPKRAGAWAETVSEHPVAEPRDRLIAAAEYFVDAVQRGSGTASNAREAADAALVWERARASMARDGEPLAVAARGGLPGRPALAVIEGGGQTSATYEAPHLTLVGQRS